MAISRAVKTEKIKILTRELAMSTSAIVGTFKGLTASKDFELRKAIRGAGGSYHVVKNKLAARASQGSKIENALQGLKGVSAVAYTAGDPVALAKALSTWVKDNSEFTFKLGIVDGKLLSVEEIGDLATMPGKEELFSKLLFLIQSPAQRLATVINATGRDLAVVLGQGVEKEKFSAGTPNASPAQSPDVPSEVSASPSEVSANAGAAVMEEPKSSPNEHDEATTVYSDETLPGHEDASAAVSKVTEAHTEQAPTPAEQIAEHPESEADPVAEGEPAQPENGTASQAGEAASSDPAEG